MIDDVVGWKVGRGDRVDAAGGKVLPAVQTRL